MHLAKPEIRQAVCASSGLSPLAETGESSSPLALMPCDRAGDLHRGLGAALSRAADAQVGAPKSVPQIQRWAIQ
eukprot:6292463-Pyramimonas_sp.AAC.1